MIAAVASYTIKPEYHDEYVKMAEASLASLRHSKGCREAFRLADHENNMFCHVSLWETRKDLDDYHEQRDRNNPNAWEEVMKGLAKPPFRHIYEVTEP